MVNEAYGVILYRTGDSTANTSAPGDDRDVAWNLQGTWGNFLGTPISSTHFITAKHVGGTIGQSFNYDGGSYVTTARYNSPSTDLTIWEVSGAFNSFAPLYTDTNELGKEMFVMGRGTQRGAEVNISGATVTDLRGWRWGTADKVKRWGENNVEGFQNSGTLLYGGFDRTSPLTEEAHLSVGDSGGAVFLKDADDQWKLAGINYSVDAFFNLSDSNTSEFNAAIFDAGGMYFGNDTDGYNFVTDQIGDISFGFYSTRISSQVDWIESIIPVPEISTLAMVGGVWMLLTLVKHICRTRS